MTKEIFNDLKNRYLMGHETIKLTGELNNDPVKWYNFRLLTIFVKDDYEQADDDAEFIVSVRCQKLEADGYEKISVICYEGQKNGGKGFYAKVEDVDDTLMGVAESIEDITERIAEAFEEKVISWNWLGD